MSLSGKHSSDDSRNSLDVGFETWLFGRVFLVMQVFFYFCTETEHEDLANAVTRCRAEKLARSNHVEESECSSSQFLILATSKVILGQKIPFPDSPRSAEEATMSVVLSVLLDDFTFEIHIATWMAFMFDNYIGKNNKFATLHFSNVIIIRSIFEKNSDRVVSFSFYNFIKIYKSLLIKSWNWITRNYL